MIFKECSFLWNKLYDINLWIFKAKWFIISVYEYYYKYNDKNRIKLRHAVCNVAVAIFSLTFLTTLTSFEAINTKIMEDELVILEAMEIAIEESSYVPTDQVILQLKPGIQQWLLDKIVANITRYENKIDREHLITLMYIESKFEPNAKSYTGEWNGAGICQVSQPGLDDYNRVNGTNHQRSDLYNVDINIMIGVWIYTYNRDVYTNASDHRELYVAYNIGSGTYNSYSDLYINGLTKDHKEYRSLSLYDEHYQVVASVINLN